MVRIGVRSGTYAQIPLIVDATTATPYLISPIKYGGGIVTLRTGSKERAYKLMKDLIEDFIQAISNLE